MSRRVRVALGVAIPALLPAAVGVVDVLPAPPPVATPSVTVEVPVKGPEPHLSLPEEVALSMASGAWADAAEALAGLPTKGVDAGVLADRALVRAYCLVRADRAEEAAPLLPQASGARSGAFVGAWVRAMVAAKLGDEEGALRALEEVPEGLAFSREAAYARATVLEASGDRAAAFEAWSTLAAEATPDVRALEGVARTGEGTNAEKRLRWQEIWSWYPATAASRTAVTALAAYGELQPTQEQRIRRVERLMGFASYDTAVSEAEGLVGELTRGSADWCRVRYALGRSHYKRNRLGATVEGFADAGSLCPDQGNQILYLQGMAEYRRGRYTAAAVAYQKLPELFPDSSYADDGLTRAGIALQEADDLSGAQALWRRALEDFPAGDTVPEASWRLAWTLYLGGEADEAVRVASRLGTLDPSLDPTHVAAGRYWAARWSLYPDPEAPRTPSSDPSARVRAIAGWEALCESAPDSYYAALAHSRLREEAPDRAAQLLVDRDRWGEDGERTWTLRRLVADDPRVGAARELLALGLLPEARAELDALDADELTPQEIGWLTGLRMDAGDLVFAHGAIRDWVGEHPPWTLGELALPLTRVAYPDFYWTEVRGATSGVDYDPRLLHALVREESNFNRRIVSFAGAKGLAQLMPATAQEVARRMGRSITEDDLFVPSVNLALGANYLDTLHDRYDGSPFLALAAYNAGVGRVDQWLGEWGDIPTDEYVERIPFRETRGYVKRVMSTWQTYRYAFDDGVAYVDVSRFNQHVQP